MNLKLIPQVIAANVSTNIRPPDFGVVLSFVIRAFFAVAALAAILYLLLGAFAWITSGGDKEAVGKAREKIQAAVIGLVLIFAVLSIAVLVEQILGFGLGLSEPLRFPELRIEGISR